MMHEQTLLAYEMNGDPLNAKHGFPLRLVIPVKYGIKNLKQIGKIFFSDERPPDYWAERGYDWYAGLWQKQVPSMGLVLRLSLAAHSRPLGRERDLPDQHLFFQHNKRVPNATSSGGTNHKGLGGVTRSELSASAISVSEASPVQLLSEPSVSQVLTQTYWPDVA